MKHRFEEIVSMILEKGGSGSRQSAWGYLRSESAKAEAELISISRNTQESIIAIIQKITPEDLKAYNTQKIIDKVSQTLSKLVGDSRVIAERMILANIIAGKVKGKGGTPDIAEEDHARIDKMVDDITSKIQQGASLTLSSIKTLIQNGSIRANMGDYAEHGDNKNENIVKQQPTQFLPTVDAIEEKNTSRTYPRASLSKAEIENISNDPIAYAREQSHKNINEVNRLHNEYMNGLRVIKTLNTKQQLTQSKKEINGNSADKALFEMNKLLRSQGVYAFVDNGGKRWTLETYCVMAARNSSARTTNIGEMFSDGEHDLYYIVPHKGSCPLCAKYEGRVYSKSGTNPNYPKLSSVFGKIDPSGGEDLDNMYLTIHPNCRHKLIKYHENNHTRREQKKIIKESNWPIGISRQQQDLILKYKENEHERSQIVSAMREFTMYLQVMSASDVCENFKAFYANKKQNTEKYKEIKRKYNEIIKNM